MNALLSTELLKLRTTRALGVATGVVVAFAVALPVVGGFAPTLPSLAEILRAPAALAGGAVLLVGLLCSAGEFRHRTVLTTRLAEPHPSRVLGAKLIAMALVGLTVGVAVEAAAAVAGIAVLVGHDAPVGLLSRGVLQAALAVPVVLALHGVIGAAVGALVRSTAGAIGATLVWAFVVEGALPVLLRRPALMDWLPGGLAKGTLRVHAGPGEPTALVAGLLLLLFAVAVATAATALDRSREL